MSFPTYPTYKDSGFTWLGKVPEHWALKRLGQLFSERRERASDTEFEPLSVTKDGIVPRLETAAKTQDGDNRKKVLRGDFVINSRSDRKGSAGLSPLDGSVSLICTVITPDGISGDFAHHLLRSVPFQEEYYRWGKGIVADLWSTNFSDMKNIVLGVPSETEQTQIARFLDHETARIDALIEEQQRLIELLKEKRQAVISHAVTKGLDPTVPMKDSGVEWLGKVPAHWVKKRLKNISPFITVGIVVNPSDYVSDEGLPFLYGGEVKEGFIEVDKARKISPEDSKKNRKTMLETGDIVTMRVGYPGLTAVVPPECAGGNCASVMLVKRGNYDSHWLCAVMNSRLVRQQVEVVQYGAAQKQFNIADAIEFWMFEPPREEQTMIAEYIDRQSSVFNALMEASERSRQLLQERRSALISAAVTGKIDVRGWQPPASTQAPESAVAEAV